MGVPSCHHPPGEDFAWQKFEMTWDSQTFDQFQECRLQHDDPNMRSAPPTLTAVPNSARPTAPSHLLSEREERLHHTTGTAVSCQQLHHCPTLNHYLHSLCVLAPVVVPLRSKRRRRSWSSFFSFGSRRRCSVTPWSTSSPLPPPLPCWHHLSLRPHYHHPREDQHPADQQYPSARSN